jgi:hypothetical protein
MLCKVRFGILHDEVIPSSPNNIIIIAQREFLLLVSSELPANISDRETRPLFEDPIIPLFRTLYHHSAAQSKMMALGI